MRVLIVDDCAQRQFAITALDNIFDEVIVIEAVSETQACDFIEQGGQYDLVVLGHELSSIDNSKVYSLLQSKGNQTHCVINTCDDRLAAKVVDCGFPESPYLNKTYRRIRTFYFWRFNKSICDTFVGLSEEKYVKILNRDDVYNREVIEKYAKKNQTFLYIRLEDYLGFLKTLHSAPYLSCVNENATTEEAATTTIALSQEIVKRVGITKTVIEMANSYVKTVVNPKNKSKLGVLLSKARKKKDYIYDHSYLLSFICTATARNMTWGSEQVIEKLCLASMFHDITIEDPEMAMLQDLDESVLLRYTPEQINEYTAHPEEVVRLIQQANKFPLNIDEIVMQHHENVTSTGFPKKVNAMQISPMSALFIVCHDFVSNLYKIGFNQKLVPEVLKKMKDKYDKGNFLKSVTALNEAFSALE